MKPTSRLAVNVNFHHLSDILRGDEPLPHLTGRSKTNTARETVGALQAGLQSLQEVSLHRDHLVASGVREGSLLQSFLADLALRTKSVATDGNGVLQPVFSSSHRSYLGQYPSWRARVVRARITRFTDVEPVELPDATSIALFGDWAVGTPAAAAVAATVQDSRCDVAIHLGDVYYSGTMQETQRYLLDMWPGNARLAGRACNSNHEMFSGGAAYFEATLPALGQTGSLFSLRNRHWLLVGLDTGTVDARLGHDQAQAVVRLCSQAGDRRIILLSHHPMFSPETGVNQELRTDIRGVLQQGSVAAWVSAHDHAYVRFEQEAEFGVTVTCVGHGGFPYLALPTSERPAAVVSGPYSLAPMPARQVGLPSAVALQGPADFQSPAGIYGPMGWSRLTLDGPHLFEHTMDLDGVPRFGREIA